MIIMSMMLTACSRRDAAHAQDKAKENIEKINIEQDSDHEVIEKKEELVLSDSSEEKDEINTDNIMMNLDFDVGYEKLEDIHPNKIKEIPIDYIGNLAFGGKDLESISDGFITINKDDDRSRIRRLDENGHILWVKPLDVTSEIHRVYLRTLKDNHFIVATVSSPSGGPDFLLSYDEHGQLLWKKDLYDYGFKQLEDMILTDSQDILLVGSSNTKDALMDIKKIVSLNGDGNKIREATFGGHDYESLKDVQYHHNVGIVLLGNSQSHDGDFAIKGGEDITQDFLACINEKKLQLSWVRMASKRYDGMMLLDRTIYVNDSVYKPNSSETSIEAYDRKGMKINEYIDTNGGSWAEGMALLSNSYLVLGHRERLGYEQGYGSCHLQIFNPELELVKTIEDTCLSLREIIATEDGGFMLKKMVRPIKTLPQPVIISSIWYDYETVLAKYNNAYELQWRKTYNLYSDSTVVEWIKPLPDGIVLIESSKVKALRDMKKKIFDH